MISVCSPPNTQLVVSECCASQQKLLLRWSFVGRKENKHWIWMAMDTATKQVIAFYAGDRSRRSARKLWQRIPAVYREQAIFYTDAWEAYKKVIPAARHRICAKRTGHTNIIEQIGRAHV